MDWTTSVAVHESAAPEFVRERILKSLGSGRVEPSVLYAGLGQTLKWNALYRAFSPAEKDESCAAVYDEAFHRIAGSIRGNVAHVVSLGCGDGSKDARCLAAIRGGGRIVLYSPVDFSLDMVLIARKSASAALRGLQCTPLLCDLAHCSVLPAILKGFDPSGAERVILFLGTIHNYWPPDILKSVLYPLRSQDHLLIGANLVRSDDYEEAVARVLPQYENDATRHWLVGALSEFGLTERDGELVFTLERAEGLPALRRIEVNFSFKRAAAIDFFGSRVLFDASQKLRVFYSYRFTREIIRKFLAEAHLQIADEWITAGGEEGLFLCRRSSGQN